MRHATHTNESCHAYECVMSHMWIGQWPFLLLLRIWTCHLLLVFVWPHTWMRHFFGLNLIRTKYERVMSHICISRVTHLIEPCRIDEWNNALMSGVTHMNMWCYTHEWITSRTQRVIPHFWLSQITHMNNVTNINEWYHTYDWVRSLTWMSPDWMMPHTLIIHFTTCHYLWFGHTYKLHVTHPHMSWHVKSESCQTDA